MTSNHISPKALLPVRRGVVQYHKYSDVGQLPNNFLEVIHVTLKALNVTIITSCVSPVAKGNV